MTDRPVLDRALPMLEIVPPEPVAAPRAPAAPADTRLGEYLPEARTLPRFHLWTLGCQMNRSDSEEMAGRLLQAGCAEASGFEDADLIVINTCAIREGGRAEGHRSTGSAGASQGGPPGSPRRADRVLRPGAGPRRPPTPVPGRRPVPAAR